MLDLQDGKRRYFQLTNDAQMDSKLTLVGEIVGLVCMFAGALVGAWAIWRDRTR